MNKQELTIAVIMLHGGCNMKCGFCITDDRLECMTAAEYGKTLTRVKEQGFQNVVLGGGEPFLWPSGVDYATRKARDMGFLVQVGTNGVNMPDRDIYRDSVDRYVLPLDAHNAEGHNTIRRFVDRGKSDHYAIIGARLQQCREWGRPVTVSTVVSGQNHADINGIGDFLADYVAQGGRLHAWHLYRFIPRGRGGARAGEVLNISRTEFDTAVHKSRQQNYPFTIFKRPDMRHSSSVDFFWHQEGHLCVGSEVWDINRSKNLVGTPE